MDESRCCLWPLLAELINRLSKLAAPTLLAQAQVEGYYAVMLSELIHNRVCRLPRSLALLPMPGSTGPLGISSSGLELWRWRATGRNRWRNVDWLHWKQLHVLSAECM